MKKQKKTKSHQQLGPLGSPHITEVDGPYGQTNVRELAHEATQGARIAALASGFTGDVEDVESPVVTDARVYSTVKRGPMSPVYSPPTTVGASSTQQQNTFSSPPVSKAEGDAGSSTEKLVRLLSRLQTDMKGSPDIAAVDGYALRQTPSRLALAASRRSDLQGNSPTQKRTRRRLDTDFEQDGDEESVGLRLKRR